MLISFKLTGCHIQPRYRRRYPELSYPSEVPPVLSGQVIAGIILLDSYLLLGIYMYWIRSTACLLRAWARHRRAPAAARARVREPHFLLEARASRTAGIVSAIAHRIARTKFDLEISIIGPPADPDGQQCGTRPDSVRAAAYSSVILTLRSAAERR